MWIGIFFLLIGIFFWGLIFISSIFEREWRASLISFLSGIIETCLFVILLINRELIYVKFFLWLIFIVAIFFFVLSFVRFFPEIGEEEYEIKRFDERCHMFSRNQLKFHPDISKKFYEEHPEFKEIDEKIHKLPELGDEGSKFFDPYFSAIPKASFDLLDRGRFLAMGDVADVNRNISMKKLSQVVKFVAKFYGASDVGITELRDYHFYSHRGRHKEYWGKEINSNHKTAIVIVMQMDQKIYKHSPTLPVLMESARKYVETAKIANIVAEYFRTLGFDSRAHVDAEYEVLCVPLARDAGLGNVGRHGLFIHKKFGPCVRLSVVTTEAKLLIDNSLPDKSIEFFCKICKKCAENCPTGSISSGEKPVSRGFSHWSIKQETCYSYWKMVGSDCGFCIRVCPYNKPNTLLHRLVRFYISRNIINQKIALFMDDFLYGRKFRIRGKNPNMFSLLK